jgi:hypothetical protein
MEELIDATRAHGDHPGSLQLMLDRQMHLLAAELEWLDHVIAQLQTGRDKTTVQGGHGS